MVKPLPQRILQNNKTFLKKPRHLYVYETAKYLAMNYEKEKFLATYILFMLAGIQCILVFFRIQTNLKTLQAGLVLRGV